ncbi:MAG: M20 family metallopeptidase [Desulfatirhabdiaceae bacterium]
MNNLKKSIQRQYQKIVQFRRDLHQIPETAYTEEKTSQYVADVLSNLGISVFSKIARYGVVGLKSFTSPGKTLMLRSELDALPIVERTGLPFASKNPACMHACGHDGHMAMVLGAAVVLCEMNPDLCGQIKFLFQPAEEGPGGAKPMIEAGVMESPRVDFVLGCHLWPNIPEGTVGVRPGPLMAAMDRFDITIIGRGGHGAMPHLCVDALETGTQVVGALQRIVSRHMNPLSPTVLTVGRFEAGTAFNVIPNEARICGTTRTFDPEIWKSWPTRIETVVRGVCQSMGADYRLDYQPGYPVTVNDTAMCDRVREFASATVGAKNVVEPEATMGGEDMSFFLERAPGCFFFLGTGCDGGAPIHNERFDFNENILMTGVEIYCRAAMAFLGKPPLG